MGHELTASTRRSCSSAFQVQKTSPYMLACTIDRQIEKLTGVERRPGEVDEANGLIGQT